jgi:hemolysin activation/secretion protein
VRLFFLFIFFCVGALHSDEELRIEIPPDLLEAKADDLLASHCSNKIHTIVLVNDEHALLDKRELETAEGLVLVGLDLPGSSGSLKKELEPWFNRQFDSESVREIKQSVYRYFQAAGYPFILIQVPRQKCTSAVQLIVRQSTLGKVEVSGNQWTSTKRYTDYFQIQPGETISQRKLLKNVDFMNRNPYRQVSILFTPGEQPYTTDLTLKVSDRKPYRFYLGFDNNGVPTTGRQRVFAGFSWDQLFGLDHLFFYQYTTNYNASRFHANTFQYFAMLPWEAVFNLYGGYSIVHANLPPPNRINHGTNIQASLRYLAPLLPFQFFSHELSFGVDVKSTNNTVEFVDYTPTFGQTVNMTELMLGYKYRYENGHRNASGGIECYVSPVNAFPGQTEAAFNSLRPGAANRWIYGFAYCTFKDALPWACSYLLYFKGQLSSAALLPSEQLGIGGHSTVRGYDERQYNADNGLLGSFEFHLPTFSIIQSQRRKRDQAYFLLFADGGYGVDAVVVPEVPNSNFLVSVGPGFRYFFDPYLTARCDWGIKLHHQDDFTGGASMVQFSVTGSY